MKRILITVIATFLIITSMWIFSASHVDGSPLTAETVKPTRKNIYDYINAAGKIREGNKRNIYVSSPGKISEIYVKEGDVVSVGDVLAEITPVFAGNYNEVMIDIAAKEMSSLLTEYVVDTNFEPEDITVVEIDKEPAKILSPISGTVTTINAKKGESVYPVFRIMSVSDFDDLYISANIPEEYSSKVSKGDKVKISSAAFENKIYSGSIEAIAPTATYLPSLTGAGETYIEAKVSISNPSACLRPGLNVNAKITANTKENALTLPYECILQDENNREYVYCIEEGIAKKRFIITGYELENEVEIKSGIMPGDEIIINPGEENYDNKYVAEN